jgi:eukaryotic-like serine/threonine-protein kinase
MKELLEGTTLQNQYFLRRYVGSGGSADVYEAWDRKRSTNMAVKVLRNDHSHDSHVIRMFEEEAALLSELTHPNIVRLYEFGKQGKILFFVMDWIEGTDLKQAIQKRQAPFPVDEVIHIIGPISRALDYAHKENVFHCDVKPGNILLHEDGRVFLSDFGIARRVLKSKGGAGGPGTPPYMAPEQFTGGRIDARTDVYGLGVVLYQMLSGGTVPFRGESPQSPGETTRERIQWEHLHLPLEPLAKYNPKLPDTIDAVIEKALNKDASSRYPSVSALREAFEDVSSAVRGLDIEKGRKRDISGDTVITPPSVPKPIHQKVEPSQSPSKAPSVYPSVRIHGPHLLGISGEFSGRMVPLTNKTVTLGRGKDNLFRLQDPSVSRRQVTILKTRRGVYIRDEQSTLGTYVNGLRITIGRPVLLRNGDHIRLGYFQEFEFRDK